MDSCSYDSIGSEIVSSSIFICLIAIEDAL